MSMFWRHVGLKLHFFSRDAGSTSQTSSASPRLAFQAVVGSPRPAPQLLYVAIFAGSSFFVRLRLRLESDAELKGSQEPKVK